MTLTQRLETFRLSTSPANTQHKPTQLPPTVRQLALEAAKKDREQADRYCATFRTSTPASR